MNDRISRKAAIDEIRKCRFVVDAIEKIRGLPSAEPKTGKWIIQDNPKTGWYKVECSECDEDVTSNIPMIGFFPHCKPLWDFCPHCGADMRGEEE